MPVYEYVCADCGATTESLRRMADADQPQKCSKCGSGKTKRAHSVFATSAGGKETPSLPMGGGCGRCGDPNGPCSLK